jgi:hypothetical protein
MMSRKDYVEVAKIFDLYREDMDQDLFRNLVDEFSDFFAEDNPNFDSDRFAKACGFEFEKIK